MTPISGQSSTSRPVSGLGWLRHKKRGSWPISRVLSWTVIHLGRRSRAASCSLPADSGGPPVFRKTCLPIWPCSGWGLPVGTVARPTVRSYRTISPLPDLTCVSHRRYVSVALSVALGPCGLIAPRRYLASCPVEPGLSSRHKQVTGDCLANSGAQYNGEYR